MAVTSPLRHANVNASGHLSFPSLDFWDPQSSKLADIVEEACTMLSSILHTSLPTYHGSLSCLAILLVHHWGRDKDCSYACSACAAMHSLGQQSAILFSSLLYSSAVCYTLQQSAILFSATQTVYCSHVQCLSSGRHHIATAQTTANLI